VLQCVVDGVAGKAGHAHRGAVSEFTSMQLDNPVIYHSKVYINTG